MSIDLQSRRRPALLESRFLRRYFTGLATAAQVGLDGATCLAACSTAYVVWCRIQPQPRVVPISVYAPLFVGIAAIVLILFWRFGMYRQQKSILNIEEFKGVLKTTVLGFLLAVALHFLLEESLSYPRGIRAGSGLYRLLADLHDSVAVVPPDTWSRYVLLLSFAFIFVFMSLQRWVCFKGLQYLHLKGIGTANIVIVGTGAPARILQKRLFLSPRLGFNLAGFVDDDPAVVGQPIGKARVLATTDRLEEIIRRHKIGLVMVAYTDIRKERLKDLAERCRGLAVEVAFVPPYVLSGDLPPLRVGSLEMTPVLTFSPVRQGPVYRACKRAFDLATALLGLLANLPLFVVLPALIKLESEGPAFFRQQRVGRDGRVFDIFKFRTMRVNAPKYGVSPRTDDDPRLTRLGRILRRTSIDELPQLLNVLKGDMSIVGPRPEMPFIVDQYDALVRQRLLAKPGLTGLWQISYAREEDIHENVDYDLYYVQHPSLTMDFVIVILTVFSVIRGVGAR